MQSISHSWSRSNRRAAKVCCCHGRANTKETDLAEWLPVPTRVSHLEVRGWSTLESPLPLQRGQQIISSPEWDFLRGIVSLMCYRRWHHWPGCKKNAACWVKGTSPSLRGTAQRMGQNSPSWTFPEYLRRFTDGISWLHRCSSATCPVWSKQQNRLACKGQLRPGGEALQMVAGQPAAMPAGSSGGSSSLNVPDHIAPRTPTFCCLCSLESIDGFAL